MIKPTSKTRRAWRLYTLAARFLVFTSLLLLAVLPWTERYWSFDGFYQGHPDFEMNLLAFLTILCLILLLAHLGGRGIWTLLSVKRWLWFVFKRGDIPALDQCAFVCELDINHNSIPGLGSFNAPLQV